MKDFATSERHQLFSFAHQVLIINCAL